MRAADRIAAVSEADQLERSVESGVESEDDNPARKRRRGKAGASNAAKPTKPTNPFTDRPSKSSRVKQSAG